MCVFGVACGLGWSVCLGWGGVLDGVCAGVAWGLGWCVCLGWRVGMFDCGLGCVLGGGVGGG